MTPYYADDYVTLYHGDCRELLPSIEADVVVTDPPYGVDLHPIRGKYEAISGDAVPFDPAFLVALGKPTVLFGGNHYAERLPSSAAWWVWDKRVDIPSNLQSDCELAWTNIGMTARMYRQRWNGGAHKSMEAKAEARTTVSLHPTQKPLGLMRWVLERVPPGTVLDPFAGSGTTLVAAKSLNRKAIGIEIEERYCEVAATRLSQEVLGLTA